MELCILACGFLLDVGDACWMWGLGLSTLLPDAKLPEKCQMQGLIVVFLHPVIL